MQPQAGPAGLQRAPAAEQQLWTYLTQLAMALRALHTAGLAVGSAGLAATKVLLTSRATARIKIGMQLQRKGLVRLRSMLMLICSSTNMYCSVHPAQLVAHALCCSLWVSCQVDHMMVQVGR